MSESAFGGVRTSWNRTIQQPLKATIEDAPASRDQPNTRPDTGLARNRERRKFEVLRGHHLPPKYCHISQRRSAITPTAQGIPGLMRRLITRRAPQTPWPYAVMARAMMANQ